MGVSEAFEGYYEDDGEFLDEPEPSRGERLWGVISGSYGISLIAHGAVLAVLATIVITAPARELPRTVTISPAPRVEPYDPTVQRAMDKSPEIEAPQEVEQPIIVQEEEVELTQDVPRGTDLSNATNKNLDSTSVIDAYGPGPGAAGAYGSRWGKGCLAKEGGSPATESAVRAALRWLGHHQHPDGHWSADGWTGNCGGGLRGEGASCSGPGTNLGDPRYDAGLTSLSLLAFLGNGNSHRFGTFKRNVQRGLTWLKRQQRTDGSIGFSAGETIYNHALATMALCEAYAISRDFTLRRPAQRAVGFCVAAQNPRLGWRYGVRLGQNDTSVTGWMVLALKAARVAGLEVPPASFAGTERWLERATDSRGNTGYQTPGGGSSFLALNEGKYDPVPCMTAVGVLCRIFAGAPRSAAPVRQGSALVLDSLPVWQPPSARTVNFYYWYYGTYAMFQVGGERWQRWNQAMQDALLPNQRVGACEDGSWDPVGEWCLVSGRVYATAINALTLEIYYRYQRAHAG